MTNQDNADILAGLMTGLGSITKIPSFTPTNPDLVTLADAVAQTKTAAAAWPKTANAAVAAMVVDAYNAANAYNQLHQYAEKQKFVVNGANQYYYSAYVKQANQFIASAQSSCSIALRLTDSVLTPLLAAVGALEAAASAVETKEKTLQSEIQQLESVIASSQQTIAAYERKTHSWWYELLSISTAGLFDIIESLVSNVDSLQSQLAADEQTLRQDINSFNIYLSVAPIAGTCSQLAQSLYQWSEGFFDSLGRIEGPLMLVQHNIYPGANPTFLQLQFRQMEIAAQEALSAIENLENVQAWVKAALNSADVVAVQDLAEPAVVIPSAA